MIDNIKLCKLHRQSIADRIDFVERKINESNVRLRELNLPILDSYTEFFKLLRLIDKMLSDKIEEGTKKKDG